MSTAITAIRNFEFKKSKVYQDEYDLIIDEINDCVSTDWSGSTVSDVLTYIEENSRIDSIEFLIFVRDDFDFNNVTQYEKETILKMYENPKGLASAEKNRWLQKVNKEDNLHSCLKWLMDQWKDGYVILIG